METKDIVSGTAAPQAVGKTTEKLPKIPTTAQVLLKLFIHSIAMFTLPIAAYFMSKNYMEDQYDVQPPQSYIYAAICSVVVIQAIIFCYVYQAFKEDQLEKRIKKAGNKQD